jgi:hypothetical protein
MRAKMSSNVAVLGGPIEGLEYRLASCGGLEFGYNGLGIDVAREDGKLAE